MPDFDIDIDIREKSWLSAIPDIQTYSDKIIKTILNALLPNSENIEISIVLADDLFVHDLNRDYRNKDKPTNVLSFPQTEDDEMHIPFIMLGDIIISFQTIKKEAEEQSKTIRDHYTHMLVHGCLHLMHYDHVTDAQAQEMESLEIEFLDALGIKNPYEL